LKQTRRRAYFEAALDGALSDLNEDRFVSSLGRFREALSWSRGFAVLERKVCDAATVAAAKLTASHWRFAEVLLEEAAQVVGVAAIPSRLWDGVAQQRREEIVRVAIDESGQAEHTAYLPHVRNRLCELVQGYPGDGNLRSRLDALDGLLAQRVKEERDKNLQRLTLFRDRVDFSDRPETLQRFAQLAAPFTKGYDGDPAFVAILDEIQALYATYEKSLQLLEEKRLQEVMQTCDEVLRRRPANVLFCALEEKARGREWVMRLVKAGVQRAREFEQRGQYAEAVGEWEALREIDPHLPDLDSEILHCTVLKQEAEALPRPERPALDETAITPEVLHTDSADGSEDSVPLPAFLSRAQSSSGLWGRGVKIAMTEEAWNNLKTGLAAAFALLLMVLLYASNARR